jgi:hypothetical protein
LATACDGPCCPRQPAEAEQRGRIECGSNAALAAAVLVYPFSSSSYVAVCVSANNAVVRTNSEYSLRLSIALSKFLQTPVKSLQSDNRPGHGPRIRKSIEIKRKTGVNQPLQKLVVIYFWVWSE